MLYGSSSIAIVAAVVAAATAAALLNVPVQAADRFRQELRGDAEIVTADRRLIRWFLDRLRVVE